MPRRTLIALMPLLLAAETAPPPPPWAEASGTLDAQPRRARIERDGALVVDDGAGRELQRVPLGDARRIRRATVRFVAVEGHGVVHARAELDRGQAAEAVVDGKQTLFADLTGPLGDGERARRLRVDGDGVVQYQTARGFERCDGDALLFPERWDFGAGRFRAVIDEPPTGKRLKSGVDTPMGLGAPPLGLFHFVAASTDASGLRRADQLGAPRELEDGAPATVWHAGFDGAARGAWATARAVAVTPKVRAIEIVGGKEAPRSIAIILGPASEQQLTVDVGPGAHWAMLPEPVATSCVSIAVAEPGPRDNTIAEVAIYTDVDGPDGIDRLVRAVAEQRADADGAAHVLAARGAEAARAVGDALPTTHGPGRRRLLQVLAAIGSDVAAPALGRALETAEPADRALLVDALAKMGAAGEREAVRVYGDASQTSEARADAAAVLGRVADAGAADALVAGAGGGDAQVRVATMRALTMRCAEAPAMATALAAGGDDARVGDLARALAHCRAAAPAAAIVDAWRRTRPQQFALRLRLVRALGDCGDARAQVALAEAARDDDAVVRAEAVRAAGPSAVELARTAARDRDPSVRRAALVTLGGGADVAPLADEALAHDGWPMVRRAAAESLGEFCAAQRAPVRPSLTTALGADAAESVRVAALAAIARCAEPPFAIFTGALADKKQPAGVRELAAALVARHGGAEAARALATALDDVLGDPNADERSVGAAVAMVRGLQRVGDTSTPVLEALGEAANEPLSPSVRAAAMETIGALCPPGSGEALHKGERDPDGSVQRAARSALARCHR